MIVISHTANLAEIPQHNLVKFALAKKVGAFYNSLHPLIKCRDFFNEVIFQNNNPEKLKSSSIYGFHYSVLENPLPKKDKYLIIEFSNQQQKTNFKFQFATLNLIEIKNRFKQTKIVYEEHTRLVLQFSTQWTKTCLAFNMFTAVIKLLCLNLSENWINNYKNNVQEVRYVDSVSQKFYEFVLHNISKLNRFAKGNSYGKPFDSVVNLHNSAGIVSTWRTLFLLNRPFPKDSWFADMKNLYSTWEAQYPTEGYPRFFPLGQTS